MKSGFVSILGRPNAGKSTLLNALLGQKLAIVTSKPQTTRTSIQGVVTTDNYQIVFVDTPGIHRSNTLMNKRMMDTVRASASADVVLFLIDVLEPLSEEDSQAIDLVKKLEAPAIAVLNKVDKLHDKPKLLAMIEQLQALHSFAEFIPISAMKGTGIDSLLKEIVKRLPKGEAMYPEDHLTDQPSRFLAAEILREKILHHTQQEVPHAVAVMVDTWVETPKLLKIAATIYVEKAGQKAILIGAGGAGLKKIGTLARYEMEKTFERKIFLQTFVKVKTNWRQDPEFLASIDWRSMMGQ
jgi:GTP-binding protein Era